MQAPATAAYCPVYIPAPLFIFLVHPCTLETLRQEGGIKRRETIYGRAGGTRTPNIRFWRPALYQLELQPFGTAIHRVSPDMNYTAAPGPKQKSCRQAAAPCWYYRPAPCRSSPAPCRSSPAPCRCCRRRRAAAWSALRRYRVSRCSVCDPQEGQCFLSSSRSLLLTLFLVVL